MGDENQFRFVSQFEDLLEGPFLEIGSRNYGSTSDYRSLFRERGDYLGTDMLEGEGVDIVLDLTRDFGEIDQVLSGRRFRTILCMSVLEHCEDPFAMARNMTSLLEPGGHLVVSVPFAWEFHGYPSDYWRFTHEGIMKLFPDLNFDVVEKGVASLSDNEFEPLDKSLGKLQFSFKENWRKGRKGRAVSSKILKTLAKLGILSWLAGSPYVLAPTMVNMIGRK